MGDARIPNRELTRRSFLETSAVAGGAAVLAGANGNLVAQAAETTATMTEEVKIGRCLYGGCFNCEREVVIRDGHMVNTRPSKKEIVGRRPCQRAYNQILLPYYPNRLKYPMKRVEGTERGAGQWERISWDEAFDLMAEKISYFQTNFGTRSVAIAQSTGGFGIIGFLSARFAAQMGMTWQENAVDMASGLGFNRVWGSLPERPQNDQYEEDLYNARHLVIWGSNASESSIQRYRHYLMAQRRGTKIHYIDPNETMLASRAYRWYPIRHATDSALILSCCQIILEEGLEDRAFMEKESAGAYLLKPDGSGYLRMGDIDEAYPKTIITYPYGPDYPIPSEDNPFVVWDAAADAAVAVEEATSPVFEGSFFVEALGAKVKTSFAALKEHLQNYTPEKASEICDISPDSIRELARACADLPVYHADGYGWQHYDNSIDTGWALGMLMTITGCFGKPGCGIMDMVKIPPVNWEVVYPGWMPAKDVANIMMHDVVRTGKYAGEDYPVKMLFITGSSTLGGGADYNRMVETIKKFEFVATWGITYNDNCMYSDLILPSAMTPEREDIPSMTMDHCMTYSSKMVETLFEAKDPFLMWTTLANKCGLEWNFTRDEYMDMVFFSNPTLVERGITWERLRKEGTIRYKDKGYTLANHSWTTQTGKLQFCCDDYAPRMDGLPVPERTRIMPAFEPPREAWHDTELAKKYPFVLVSARARFRWHTDGWDSPWLNELEPEQTVFINPEDAAAKGVASGDLIEVFNDRGHVVARMYTDAAIRPGSVSYPKGFGRMMKLPGTFSELTSSYCNPWSYNTSFYDAVCDFRKWEGEE